MKKTMKKITAVLLAATLTLGFSLTAFAAEDDAPSFTKKYESTDGVTFPEETLEFEVSAVADNKNPDTSMITVGTDNTFAVTGMENTIPINCPTYTKPGIYRYTIKEKEGSSQGVTYDTDTEIQVAVLVSYNDDHTGVVIENVGVEQVDGEKEDSITNEYDFGGGDDASDSLTVSKTVTGNLGDLEKYFTIHVTLTAEDGKTVASDIVINGGSNTENPTTIQKGWSGSKTVDILLKNGDTVNFGKIPDGVTYKVEEDKTHIAAGTVQTPEELNGEEGYLVTYANEEGTITKGTAQEATVTNDKSTTINTGISLDSLPYLMMLLAAVALSTYVIFSRRRAEN